MDVATRHLATRALRRAGLWAWRYDEPILDRWGEIMVADVAFATARLAVDLGMSRFPGLFPDLSGSAGRAQLRLAAAGWTLATFTRADLEQRPSELAREIRALLDRLTPARFPFS
ncbi:hypothetical protein ABT297_08445 [Dactylosporangium sp. NPDC000555]|uniref:hypothetical protein n=1 Tax=Dactylosporangium sp. NPDC000555 TaxID=3154260 RepID=UPI0033227881